MFFFLFLLLGGLMIFFRSFKKKIVCLLSLELIMIFMILIFFMSGFSNSGEKSSFLPFLFTCFMVLDSTLGISLLICSSRTSYMLTSFTG